jgi:hypothetical protein
MSYSSGNSGLMEHHRAVKKVKFILFVVIIAMLIFCD